MASISLTYTWSKHASLNVELYADDSFPDAVNEACVQATRALHTTLAGIIAAESKAGE